MTDRQPVERQTTPSQLPSRPPDPAGRVRVVALLQQGRSWGAANALLLGVVLLIVFFWSVNNSFLTVDNFRNIFIQSSVIGVVAVPSALLLIAGKVDLSVGSTLALGAVTTGLLITDGVPMVVAILAGIGVGAAVRSREWRLGRALGVLADHRHPRRVDRRPRARPHTGAGPAVRLWRQLRGAWRGSLPRDSLPRDRGGRRLLYRRHRAGEDAFRAPHLCARRRLGSCLSLGHPREARRPDALHRHGCCPQGSPA